MYHERVSPGPGRQRRPLVGHVSSIAGAVCLSGCQLVFGLGDYETDAGGSGGDGAGTLGDGGNGASGGTTTVTTGPMCECGLDPIWQPVSLADQGDAAGPIPQACPDESAPINVFAGEKPGMCSSCACVASGCAPPGLECFTDAACQGTGTMLDPGSSCGATGQSFDSCRLAAEISGACTTSGGEPVASGPPFEQFFSFCGAATCDLACQAECVTTSGVPAGGCPGDFIHHYQMPVGGTVACEACSCSVGCGDAYKGGFTVGCGGQTINGTGCTDVNPTFVLPMNYARVTGSPSCTVNHDATYAGTVELGELQTVCCKQALPGVPEVP